MKQFNLRVLAADRPFYEGQALSATIPLLDGKYGVLADHQNMISTVIPGKLVFLTPDNEEIVCAVSNGFVKVEDNDVLICVEDIETPDEIDLERAKADANKAREHILHKRSNADFKSAQARLARAINRINVKNDKENI